MDLKTYEQIRTMQFEELLDYSYEVYNAIKEDEKNIRAWTLKESKRRFYQKKESFPELEIVIPNMDYIERMIAFDERFIKSDRIINVNYEDFIDALERFMLSTLKGVDESANITYLRIHVLEYLLLFANDSVMKYKKYVKKEK
ncbi:MAG: hypothetical protein ACRDCW_06765 [Sarcina sp.]